MQERAKPRNQQNCPIHVAIVSVSINFTYRLWVLGPSGVGIAGIFGIHDARRVDLIADITDDNEAFAGKPLFLNVKAIGETNKLAPGIVAVPDDFALLPAIGTPESDVLCPRGHSENLGRGLDPLNRLRGAVQSVRIGPSS